MSGRTSPVLAVDLGSAHTVAVVRHVDDRTRPLLFDGSPLLPSAVYADPETGLIVGRAAQRAAAVAPDRFEPYPKRRIEDGEVLLGEKAYPVAELFAALLRRVAAEARLVLGAVPPAVLTHPAGWGATRRAVLTAAARTAGLTVTALVAEPVAAARHFVAVTGRRGPLAVFDFGAGTLDVAVVMPDGALLAQGGLADLGGLDLDAAALHRLRPLVPEDVRLRLDAPRTDADRHDRLALWDGVRAAKEMLSRAATAPVPVPGRNAVHLTRDEFEAAAAPLVARAVEETVRVVAAAGLRPDALGGVYLVGGASRVPMVTAALHRALGVAPTILEQPELAVAEGAQLPPPTATAAPPPTTPPPSVAVERDAVVVTDPVASTSDSRPPGRSHLLIAAAVLLGAIIIAAAVVLTRPDTPRAGGSPTSSPSTSGAPGSGAATVLTRTLPGRLAKSPELKAFVAGWDSYDWTVGEGCGVAAPADRLDGRLGVPAAVAPVRVPVESIYCRNGDFAAYFSRYAPGDTDKVEQVYQRLGFAVTIDLPDGGKATVQVIEHWNGDAQGLWWSDMDCRCAGVITTDRDGAELTKIWPRYRP